MWQNKYFLLHTRISSNVDITLFQRQTMLETMLYQRYLDLLCPVGFYLGAKNSRNFAFHEYKPSIMN